MNDTSRFAGRWRETSTWDAAEFMRTRKPIRQIPSEYGPWGGKAAGIEFDDGSKVVCWSGTSWECGTEMTPDTDRDPPIFFIYEREAGNP